MSGRSPSRSNAEDDGLGLLPELWRTARRMRARREGLRVRELRRIGGVRRGRDLNEHEQQLVTEEFERLCREWNRDLL